MNQDLNYSKTQDSLLLINQKLDRQGAQINKIVEMLGKFMIMQINKGKKKDERIKLKQKKLALLRDESELDEDQYVQKRKAILKKMIDAEQKIVDGLAEENESDQKEYADMLKILTKHD